jgi:hypothetical protein
MRPTHIIVITGDFNKGDAIWNELNKRHYRTTLVTGFGNISKGRLFGLDDHGELRVFDLRQYGIAFVDQLTADGFVPKDRCGTKIVPVLSGFMRCVAIASSVANNEKLLKAGATHYVDDGHLLAFIIDQLSKIAVPSRKVHVDTSLTAL